MLTEPSLDNPEPETQIQSPSYHDPRKGKEEDPTRLASRLLLPTGAGQARIEGAAAEARMRMSEIYGAFGRAPRADFLLNSAGALPNSYSERSDYLLFL